MTNLRDPLLNKAKGISAPSGIPQARGGDVSLLTIGSRQRFGRPVRRVMRKIPDFAQPADLPHASLMAAPAAPRALRPDDMDHPPQA